MTPEIEAEALNTSAPAQTVKRHLTDFWAVILVVLTGVSYGSQAIIGKWAYANGGNAITVLTVRSVVAVIILWSIIAILKPNLRIAVRKVAELSFLGVVFLLGSITYYVSLMYVPVGTAILIAYIYPALVVVGAAIFFKEKFTRVKGIALVLALAGCALTVDPLQALSGNTNLNGFGLLMALTSAFLTTAYFLLSSRINRGVSGLLASAYSLPAIALFYVLLCTLAQIGVDMTVVGGGFAFGMNWVGWLCCILIGVLTSLAWTFYMIGVPKIGASRASILVTSEPATAVFLGILLFGEAASPVKLAGGALIFWAVYLLRK